MASGSQILWHPSRHNHKPPGHLDVGGPLKDLIMCTIDETPPSWPSNIFNPAVLDVAKLRRWDWLADYEELHYLRLFYGTSKTRWKILEGNNRLVGPHRRLYLARGYAETEFTAFQAVARDIYYGELLRAADFEVPN